MEKVWTQARRLNQNAHWKNFVPVAEISLLVSHFKQMKYELNFDQPTYITGVTSRSCFC